MQYVDFNKTTRLSRLGMGVMRLPVKKDESGTRVDYEKAQAIIDHAYASGINYFDTAYIYHNGESEVFLGKALAKYPRDSYYIADKFNAVANPNYEEQFQQQLHRLNTDHIDFYLIHGIQDAMIDPLLQIGCFEYFDKMKAEGKIQYFGFSFHGSINGLKRLLSLRKWDFVQIQLNYFDWAYGEAKALYEALEADHVPVMVMEPVRGGKLASLTPEGNDMLTKAEPERSIASWAMRWLMDLPAVTVVLSGMSDVTQVKDNVKTFHELCPLDESQKKLLAKACALFLPTVAVPCTGCRYCCTDCPKSLDIPAILNIYNEVKMDDNWRLSFLGNLEADKQPSACIGCGSCTKHCPQNIDVPAYIKELNALSEQMKETMQAWQADKTPKGDME